MDEAEVRADERDKIAYYIIAELVCCEIFQRMEAEAVKGHWDDERHQFVMPESWVELRKSHEFHPMCFYGGWAASLAKHGPDVDQRHEGWQWPPESYAAEAVGPA